MRSSLFSLKIVLTALWASSAYLAHTGESHKLKSFDTDSITSVDILAYYEKKYPENQNLDSIMQNNSSLLQQTDPYLYLKHELSRAFFLKNTPKAKESIYILDGLGQHPLIKKNADIFSSYLTLSGIINYEQHNTIEARMYYRQALAQYSIQQDSAGIKGNLVNIGSTYYQQNNYDSALFYFEKALVFDSLGIENFKWNLFNNLATVYQNIGQADKALHMYDQLLVSEWYRKERKKDLIHYNIGCALYTQKEFDASISHLQLALEKADSSLSNVKRSNIHYKLNQAFSAKNNPIFAYSHLKLADSLRIIEDQEGSKILIAELENQREQEELLRQKELAAQQFRFEKKTKNQLIIFALATTTLLLLILFLFIQKSRKNRILAAQNYELTKLKKERSVSPRKASSELITKLEIALIEEELYARNNLTLDWLAKKLKTNRTYLSESINSHYGENFRSLLTRIRIERSKELLIDKEFENYSIEGIATSVGFKSISAFNTSFKKLTGITPSFFRKNVSTKLVKSSETT